MQVFQGSNKDIYLPAIIESCHSNPEELKNFLIDEVETVRSLLLKYGAIIFRGFNIVEPQNFLNLVNTCSLGHVYDYDKCMVPRTKLLKGVYTSYDGAPYVQIPLHNEKSYSGDFPSHIYFSCLKKPTTGGSTSLASSSMVWKFLPGSLKKKFREHGVCYRRFYHSNSFVYRILSKNKLSYFAKNWQSEFETSSRSDVENIIRNSDSSFKWSKCGSQLVTKYYRAAHLTHPETYEEVYFNLSHYRNYFRNILYDTLYRRSLYKLINYNKWLPLVCNFGNDEALNEEEVNELAFAIEKSTAKSIPWQQGDFMVVDNLLCMHGKEPHSGNRYIITSMTQR